MLQFVDEAVGPGIQLGDVRILERGLILRTAYPVIDRDVLHRLHEQLDAAYLSEIVVEAANHVRGAQVTLVERLEVDRHSPAVERRVGAISPDERRKALD